MSVEKWAKIPGYEGKYLVSTLGRIKSDKTGIMLNFSKKICKAGYHNCSLGRKKTHLVHRLVALTFLGNPPDKTWQVNHKNCNKLDNRVSNLEWVSPKQNIAHAFANGRFDEHIRNMKIKSKGVNNPRAKIKESQVKTIRLLAAHGVFSKDIAKLIGVSVSMIAKIRQNKNWTHVK